MKAKKNYLAFIGLGALALALCFNFVYASNKYGISDNSLSLEVLAQMNIESLAAATGTGTTPCSGSYYKKVMTEFNKVTVTCDGKIHTTVVTPGYNVSCEGTGCLECTSGWMQGTGQPGISTSLCPDVDSWFESCPLRK